MTEELKKDNKKDNRGYLYPNGNKTKPTHPDYTGTIITDGKEQRLAAWENQSSDGKKYLSIIVSPQLTPEQQANFKRTDEPSSAVNNNNNNNNNSNNNNNNNSNNAHSSNTNNDTNSHSDYYSNSMPSDLDDDLNAILRSSDDDNPFN